MAVFTRVPVASLTVGFLCLLGALSGAGAISCYGCDRESCGGGTGIFQSCFCRACHACCPGAQSCISGTCSGSDDDDSGSVVGVGASYAVLAMSAATIGALQFAGLM